MVDYIGGTVCGCIGRDPITKKLLFFDNQYFVSGVKWDHVEACFGIEHTSYYEIVATIPVIPNNNAEKARLILVRNGVNIISGRGSPITEDSISDLKISGVMIFLKAGDSLALASSDDLDWQRANKDSCFQIWKS